MNGMTPAPYHQTTYMHRCTTCRRLFSMPLGRGEKCPCGGAFRIERAYEPNAPTCETCLGMMVFVVAGAKTGVRAVPCPDCNPAAIDELAATVVN